MASLTNLQWLGVMENALSQHAANQQLAAAITSGLRVVAVLEKYPRVETVQVYPEEPEPTEPEPVPALYWTEYGTNADRIQRANLDGSNVQPLIANLGHSGSIALDLTGGKMYWTDFGVAGSSPGKVRRANLDGTGPIEDLIIGLNLPSGIALDLVNRKMYWGVFGAGEIQRANLDGTSPEPSFITGLTNPTRIALDLANGKMYWSDTGADKIQYANLDGTMVDDLITGLITPSTIALEIR